MSDPQVTQSEQNSSTTGDNQQNSGGTNPQQQPATTPQQTGDGKSTDNLTALATLLTALPEQIAKSVKEAVGTPAKPASEAKQETQQESKSTEAKPTDTTKPVETKTPGRKSFTQWWFG